MKILISDKLSEAGLEVFKQAPGITVDYQPGLGKDLVALKNAIADADALAIRSGTQVTADILAAAPKLKVIGRAGIGVDNVDIPQATKRGVIVMNTPGGNTITTAEHAIAMMCAVARQIPQATASIKSGKWEKNRFMGTELCGKTLGVIGCGNIGKIVVSRALGLKMKVIVFDPFLTDEVAETIGVTKVELDPLFQQSDFITLHVPKTDKTANLLNAANFSKMKRGVYIINCARGGIINENDLALAIESGIVAGAAIDVFDKEPVDPNHPLLKMDQVICTPHLGAATEEAQENVALDVARQIVDFLLHGTIQNALNFPSVSGETLRVLEPYLSLAEKIGKIQGQLAQNAPLEIRVEFCGEVNKLPTGPLTIAALRGILEPVLEDESVNLVNAPVIAKERGIRITESKITDAEDFASLITVTLVFKNSEQKIAGTIFGNRHPRIVRFNDAYLEAVPEGTILVIQNEDQPGVVGSVGSLLGQKKINISRLQLGLSGKSKKAVAFYNVENKNQPNQPLLGGEGAKLTPVIDLSVLEEIRKIPGIISVQQVVL